MKENPVNQKSSKQAYPTLEEWILHESIPFSIDSSEAFNASVDKVIASLDPSVELLGFGEALHGGEEILILRNRLLQRLVEMHGYSAIAIESSFPRAREVNEYIAGRGSESYEAIQETGFSHGFSRLDANRELVEWMREYNADPSHNIKLRFYGFDSPTEVTVTDSPAQILHFVLDYLASIDSASSEEYRKRIDSLLGNASDWENPEAAFDPTKAIGLSPAATSLRIETEDLISELCARLPELVDKSDKTRYLEAIHYASVARRLLNYHAELARESEDRFARLLSVREAIMANNLEYIVSREHDRGKVLVFAHNSHLKRGKVEWQLSSNLLIWYPVGAHLNVMFGSRYAVIGSAVGVSEANGISQPETGTLEARLTAVPGRMRFIPTYRGKGLPDSEISVLPIRSGSVKNPTYFSLTPQSFADFDWLVIMDSTEYSRGGPPLQ
jgi:erythromycin esterase-like protein